MKFQTHDEKGFPLNYNPSTFYITPETFINVPYNIALAFCIDPNRYTVSNWGRIYDKYTGIIHPRTLQIDYNDYNRIMLKDINGNNVVLKAHRLVCASYYGIIALYTIGQPPIVNHKDGVKWHNEPSNLEWTTYSGNIKDASRNGLLGTKHGEDSHYAKLTDEQYHQICKYTQDGLMPKQVSDKMNLGFDISNIVQKIRTKQDVVCISDQYDFSNIPRHNYSKTTDDQVIEICKLLEQEKSEDEIIKEVYGIDVESLEYKDTYLYRIKVRRIKDRTRFTNISSEFKF